MRKGTTATAKRASKESATTPHGDLDLLAQLEEIETRGGDGTLRISRTRTLQVTSLDRIYFPGERRTKGEVMQYYVLAAPALLPILADRPLILKRYPEGISGTPFFQHDAPDNVPDGVRVATIPTEGDEARRFIGGDLSTLLHGVQLGAIEVNPWLSRVSTLDTPDFAVLDLDPGPEAPFASIVRVAHGIKEMLDAMNISAAVKTSGSRGLHIFIPLPAGTSYASSLMLAESLAEQVADRHPALATTSRGKSKRPSDAIYVDAIQNAAGKSVAAALSIRARPGATVSTPLAWEELAEDLDPDMFNADTITEEVIGRGRFWTDVMRRRNRLTGLTGLPAID